QGCAVVGAALQEAQPGRDAERDAWSGTAGSEAREGGREQALRQFLRTVHGDLRGAVAQRRIGEAGQQRISVGGQVDGGRQGQRGGDLVHQRGDVGTRFRCGDGV